MKKEKLQKRNRYFCVEERVQEQYKRQSDFKEKEKCVFPIIL